MTKQPHRGSPPWLHDVHALRALRGAGPRLLLDGSRLVGAALAAGVAIERVIFPSAYYSDAGRIVDLLEALARAGIELVEVTPRSFSRISYKADGVVAVAPYPPRSLDDALGSGVAGPVVVLDGLSDPGNIGAVVRSANAWGAAAVVAIEGHAQIRHPKCVRASMGALFHTPTVAVSRREVLERMTVRPSIALVPDGPSVLGTSWPSETTPSDLLVVLGNERRGVHPSLVEHATWRVAIPMVGVVDSLNVSNAAAVVLWELARARMIEPAR